MLQHRLFSAASCSSVTPATAVKPCPTRPASAGAPVTQCDIHAFSTQQATPRVGARLQRSHVPLRNSTRTSAATLEREITAHTSQEAPEKQLNVLIAGAGIAGLALAVALLKKGIKVQIFERDLTAIRGEGKYRGPIQVQSNALAALEAIDPDVAEEVLASGCITGDRINGLCDGETGDWYVKFDTFHPAVDKGLPVTRVISRVTLQQVLMKAIERYGGPDTVMGNSHAVSFEEGVNPVTGKSEVSVVLEDGRRFSGDVLIGADGIWSKIRKALIGETKASYSGYTCYTGISDFTPADIDIVGYRVFLGNGKYFVSSDVGGGKMQWYGFYKEPAGGTDVDGTRKSRLLGIFGNWCDNVIDLIKATPEEDIMRRDIYDRPPLFSWSKGRVALLGDSAHAMQPNLGQGGCMAIEDAHQLATDFSRALEEAGHDGRKVDVPALLNRFHSQRVLRVSTIHGMAGMAAIMASTYKAYLGEQLGPLSWITKYKIPHPGRVMGYLAMNLTMPSVLQWVLGGNTQNLEDSRVAYCSLGDKPRAFDTADFPLYMRDDEALIKAAQADWLLMTERPCSTASDSTTSIEAKGVYITERGAYIGSDPTAAAAIAAASTSNGDNSHAAATTSSDATAPHVKIEDVHVAPRHAQVRKHDGDYYLRDLGSPNGTWINGRRLRAEEDVKLRPSDIIEFGRSPSHEPYKVKLQHVSLRTNQLDGTEYTTIRIGHVLRPEDAGMGAASRNTASTEAALAV